MVVDLERYRRRSPPKLRWKTMKVKKRKMMTSMKLEFLECLPNRVRNVTNDLRLKRDSWSTSFFIQVRSSIDFQNNSSLSWHYISHCRHKVSCRRLRLDKSSPKGEKSSETTHVKRPLRNGPNSSHHCYSLKEWRAICTKYANF